MCVDLHMRVCLHVCGFACVCVCECVGVCVCACMFAHVCVHVSFMQRLCEFIDQAQREETHHSTPSKKK